MIINVSLIRIYNLLIWFELFQCKIKPIINIKLILISDKFNLFNINIFLQLISDHVFFIYN